MAQRIALHSKGMYHPTSGAIARGQTKKSKVIRSSSLVVPDTKELSEQQKIYWRGRIAHHKKQRRRKILVRVSKIALAITLLATLLYLVS
jgi:hypothetical protein